MLLFLALLAGVAAQAYAQTQTLPTASFKHYRPWVLASLSEESYVGGCLDVNLDKAPTSDMTVKYTVDGTATPGSDFAILRPDYTRPTLGGHARPDYGSPHLNSGMLTVRAGRKTGHICINVREDSVPESRETIVLQLIGGADYQVGSNGRVVLTIEASDGPTASFASASQRAGEGSGTHNVGVRLHWPRPPRWARPYSDITLEYTVDGTATAGSDYTALSGTVTVPAGATTATIPVTLIDDSVQEGSETVVLTLTAGEDYAVGGSGTHRLTIAANDGPTASFASASQSAREGSGTHDVEVRLNKAPTSDLTFAYKVGGTATAGSDFTIASSGTVTVLAGATTAAIPVTVIDDSVHESDETVVLTLVGSTGYQAGSSATLTIVDDDGPTVSFSLDTDRRGWAREYWQGRYIIDVRLDKAPTFDITLEYRVGGTATLGSDFDLDNPGTIVVAAGHTRTNTRLDLRDDSVPESDETIILTLIESTGYQAGSPGTWPLIIFDDDTVDDDTPTMSFVSASQSAAEGFGTHDVEVRLSKAPTTDITLAYTVDGTATAGSDFTIADSGTVTVLAGATTATIPVTVIDDTVHEGDETVVLTLAASGGYQVTSPGTHTLTIAANDEPGVSFASASQSAGEGSGTHDVGVTLSPAPTTAVTLSYTVGGTATPGADFTIASSGTVTVLAGATTATIPVTVIDDTVPESDETVVLTLAASGGYQVVSPGTHVLTIVDDEPVVSFASASQSAVEGSGTRNVEVTLSPAPTTALTLAYTVGGTATPGADFTIADSGTVTVLAGATTATIPVTLIDDTAPESNETVVLALAASGGYQVTSPGTHVLTIAANDAQPPATSSVSFASGTYRVNEGGDLRPELELSHWRAEDVTVKVEALDLGGAKSGEDFAAGPWRVTIPAGERRHRFSIETFDDDTREREEELLLHIAPYGHSDGVRIDTDDQLSAIAVIYDDTRVSLPETEYTVTEGATATVRVSIANPMAKAFTLDYTLSGAGGASDADVAGGLGARSVTVPAKAKRVDLAIATVQDTLQGEVGESVEVALSTTEPGVEFAARTVVVRIADDDSPAVAFASSASRAGEGAGTHDVTVSLSPAPDTPLAVPYTVTGTAVSGTDYTALSGTLTVPSGATTATVPVAIVDDTAREGDETVVLTLAAGTTHTVGARDTHTLTIADNDTPTVSFAQPSQHTGEGAGTRTVTVNLSVAQATPLALAYTVGGTATPGADFTIAGSGTLTVPAGTTTAAIPVALVADSVDDPDETVVLTLAAGEGYRVGTADTHTLYIDFLPLASFRDDYWSTVREDSGRHDLRVKFEPAPPSPLTLAYEVSGTATSGADYQALSGTVSVPAGAATATIPVTLIDDAHEDSGESVVLRLVGGTGYRVADKGTGHWASARYWERPWTHHIVWILNHDAGDLEGLLQAQLDQAVADGDAALASLCRRALALVRGEAPPDGLAPLTEAEARARAGVETGLGNTARAALWRDLAHLAGAVTTEPAVTLAAGTSPVTEGTDATFTLTATPPPASPLSVTVAIATDGDFGIAAGTQTVTIPMAGSATLTLATTGDDTDEPDGSVTATVKDGDGYTVGASALGTVAIQDDDAPPVEPAVTIAAVTSPVTEGTAAAFTLTASPVPASPLAVTVTVATDGDWGIAAGERTVTLPTAGSATLTLPTTDDNADEPDGSVSVTVKDGDGYTVGASASGTVAIADDDDAPAPEVATVDPALVTQVRALAGQTHHGQAHVNRWRRVLVAFGVEEYPGLTPTTAAEAEANAQKYSSPLWPQIAEVLAKLEAASEPDTPPVTLPAVSVTGGVAVTEGGDAVFTVTANPAPAADLPVTVAVATDGAWGITAGTQTVTVPTTGSTTLTLATTDDATDEPDGSVSVTVQNGSGYTVGAPASGSVTVQDDDEPPPDTPAVTVSAGSTVTEGGSATFTLTATPAPAADLPVTVAVATDGAYGITAGTQTVAIPTTGSATLTLATTGDATDEPDGSVSVTVTDGSGYTAGNPASGTVAIRDDDVPAVTVSGGSAVTEGGSAVFTLTASPAPASALPVSVTVATDGDYGVTAGKRTVTVPTTGSATLTLATTDDAADEPDGSATVTVQTGNGYTVGNPASGTVAVRDDDLPPPVVTIAAKAASVAEGGSAVFTLTADRAPAAALTVKLAVSETGAGDHVATSDEGPATAVLPKGATEAVFSVATVNDATDEPDGSVSVTVEPGEGYTVGAPASASVEVTDDDAPSTAPALSVGDSTAKEGARFPVMPFTVRLSSPAPGPVRVHVSTRPSTPVSARPGQDYAPGSYDLTFRVGETEKQVWIRIYDDSHDEGAETFEVVLSQAKGATIGDGVAVGTIVNDDPMPAAWLARFGRTVAEQALDGIAGRMSAPRMAGMQGALAGQAVGFDPAASGQRAAGATPGTAPANGEAALAMADIARRFGNNAGSPGSRTGIDNGPGSWSGTGPGHDATGFGVSPSPQSRTMTAREALLGSNFTLTGQEDGSGGSMAFWGRASQGSFDGREGTFSLDGEATTALLGADYARGRWLVGLALAQSAGEGDYRDTEIASRSGDQACPADAEGTASELCRNAVRARDGEVEASLTAAVPYAALQISERLKFWGAAGYGTGEVTLKTALGGSYGADTSWSMAAAGMRGDLLEAPAEGFGPALAVTSDALWTRTSSERTRDLVASDSDVTRLRVGLEGSYHVALEGGGSLVPKLEVGARRDGGDAETGFGVELGGGIAWSDPGMGLSLDVSGRTLLAHGDDDLKDRGFSAQLAWDPAPATKRSASLNLRQEFGGRASGGLDALFHPATLDDRTGSEAASRRTLEAAYGLPAFAGRWTGSPHVGMGLATGARDYTLGWRLAPEAATAPDFSFGVKATRRESDTQAPEHTVGFEIRATW